MSVLLVLNRSFDSLHRSHDELGFWLLWLRVLLIKSKNSSWICISVSIKMNKLPRILLKFDVSSPHTVGVICTFNVRYMLRVRTHETANLRAATIGGGTGGIEISVCSKKNRADLVQVFDSCKWFNSNRDDRV